MQNSTHCHTESCAIAKKEVILFLKQKQSLIPLAGNNLP